MSQFVPVIFPFLRLEYHGGTGAVVAVGCRAVHSRVHLNISV